MCGFRLLMTNSFHSLVDTGNWKFDIIEKVIICGKSLQKWNLYFLAKEFHRHVKNGKDLNFLPILKLPNIYTLILWKLKSFQKFKSPADKVNNHWKSLGVAFMVDEMTAWQHPGEFFVYFWVPKAFKSTYYTCYCFFWCLSNARMP